MTNRINSEQELRAQQREWLISSLWQFAKVGDGTDDEKAEALALRKKIRARDAKPQRKSKAPRS